MIVVDSSAVIAVVQKEEGFERFVTALDTAETAIMSQANFLEVAIVLVKRYGTEGLSRLDRLREALAVELRDVDGRQLGFAIDACARFGRGVGHPARLNYGDCFAYALARATGGPLLFKGDDFAHTDVKVA
ncbi:MAG: type II toxin-antitoxin system VapC family toxin [Pseudomonadota bacterium]|nr:type II toxin-antitoxin system VapC family toxin [Pseudomonadota bacterium]